VNLLGQIDREAKLKFLEWVCREYDPTTGDSNCGAVVENVEPG